MSIHSTQVSQRISDLKYILLIKLIYYIYVFVNIASIDSKKLAPCRTKPKLSLLNEKMYIASLDVWRLWPTFFTVKVQVWIL